MVVMAAGGIASVELAAAGPPGWALIAVGTAPVMVGGTVIVTGGIEEGIHGAGDVIEGIKTWGTCGGR
jgi:hypothetical protein